jgi:hypothetical protein
VFSKTGSSPAKVEAARVRGAVRRWFLRDEVRMSQGQKLDSAALAELELTRRLLDAAELLLDYPKLTDAAIVLLCELCELVARQRTEPCASCENLSAELGAPSPAERHARVLALRDELGAHVAELEAVAYRHERVVALRRSRVAVTALVALGCLVSALFAAGVIGPAENLALNKPVTPSSVFKAEEYPPAGLVDGNADDVGFHTELEDEPSVTIAIGQNTIRRVVVVNRIAHRERALPLVVETSDDGKTYREFARRTQVFEKWTAKGAPVTARFVRLRTPKRTYLHLNEVSVH